MHDDDARGPSKGLMYGLLISAGLYLLAGLFWLAT
jgi:hypothetical protein